MRELRDRDSKRFAKEVLKTADIKEYIKDIYSVQIDNSRYDEIESFPHMQTIKVKMNNGKTYYIFRWTVNENGYFSYGSAKWEITHVEVR